MDKLNNRKILVILTLKTTILALIYTFSLQCQLKIIRNMTRSAVMCKYHQLGELTPACQRLLMPFPDRWNVIISYHITCFALTY